MTIRVENTVTGGGTVVQTNREMSRRDLQLSFEINTNVCYDSVNTVLTSSRAKVDETEGIYEEIYEGIIPNVSLHENESSKETSRISFSPKKLFVAGMVTAILAIIVVVIMVVVIMLNLKPTNMNIVMVNRSLENHTDNNITTSINTYSNTTTNTIPVDLTSCNMLPKSSPSGYYWILSSSGSTTIRVYCDMQKECGSITGGWMRVTRLDMKQSSSKCPSSLCLNTTTPRTCRRCHYNVKFPNETYDVGVTYSHVCGKVIAYQVGKPNAYRSRHEKLIHGVCLYLRNSIVNIWSFVAATQVNYKMTENVCPCIPNDSGIAHPNSYIGSNYFCDTGTSVAQSGIFYSKNPMWDGYGCTGNNTCCSFNNPPWFCRKLPQPTTEPIVLKIGLKRNPSITDIAIEEVDIYVY